MVKNDVSLFPAISYSLLGGNKMLNIRYVKLADKWLEEAKKVKIALDSITMGRFSVHVIPHNMEGFTCMSISDNEKFVKMHNESKFGDTGAYVHIPGFSQLIQDALINRFAFCSKQLEHLGFSCSEFDVNDILEEEQGQRCLDIDND
jgi:hypothetical protein